jgi:predicted Zn-dependent protease
MSDRVERISPAVLTAKNAQALDPDAAARLQALGYASGGPAPASGTRADPKDRRELAARIAKVTSGELNGPALEKTLREILKDDPQNPLARLRLGYVLEGSNRCREAEPHFRAVIAAKAPTADAHLGLAGCLIRSGRAKEAIATLRDAERAEPGNAVVIANVGILLSDTGHADEAVRQLQRALVTDPDLHQARFALAIAFARSGRRAEAGEQASELLERLPANAPQRAEVERLLAHVR